MPTAMKMIWKTLKTWRSAVQRVMQSAKKPGQIHTHGAAGLALGTFSGWMASQHPKKAKRSAVVQVRLYAQNALNGDVLWTNRAEIEYTPKSNFAYDETHPKTMFDNAVKSGIKQLMDDFFKEAEDYSSKAPYEEPGMPIKDVKPGV